MPSAPGTPDAAPVRIEGDEKVFPDGRREPLTEYEKFERDMAASGSAHDEHTRRGAIDGTRDDGVVRSPRGIEPRVRTRRADRGRRDEGPDDRGRDRDRREPERRRSNERAFTSMGRQIREIREDSGLRYEMLVKDASGTMRVWEDLVDGQRYRVVQRGKIGTAAWELDVPGFTDFQEEASDADATPDDPSDISEQAKQLRDMFGESGEQIRMSLQRAYGSGHFDRDVVDELIGVELNLAGIANRREVETAVGALRDIAGITTDRWPDAQERALLKTIAGKLGITRALRELYATLERWHKEETQDFIVAFSPRVLEASRRSRLAGFFKGEHRIDKVTFMDDLRAAVTQDSRAGVAGIFRRSLRGVPDGLRKDIIDAVWLYISGDDEVENTRAFGMRERVKIYKTLPRR